MPSLIVGTHLKPFEMLITGTIILFGVLSNGESSDVSSHLLGVVFGWIIAHSYHNSRSGGHSISSKPLFFKKRIRRAVIIAFMLANWVWIHYLYGGDELELAASMNMGCNYSSR